MVIVVVGEIVVVIAATIIVRVCFSKDLTMSH